MADFNFLQYCIPCDAWCCKGEEPYASKQELIKLGVEKIIQKEDSSCMFLQNGKCSVYYDRPFECRIFPFDIKDIENKLYWIIWDICPASPKLEHDISITEFERDLSRKYSIEYIKYYVEYHKTNQPEKYDNISYTLLREVRWSIDNN